MNEMISIIIMVITSFFAAIGQVSLKLGTMRMKVKMSELIRNYGLLTGFLFYGVSTITGIIAMRGSELTVLYPIASLNYVWVSLLSKKFLNEDMNRSKWLGIILIIIGVLITV